MEDDQGEPMDSPARRADNDRVMPTAMKGARGKPRRAELWLLVAFILTVAAFLITAIIVERAETGIGSAAESIATNSAPSLAALSDMRTELRHVEVLVDDYLDSLLPGTRKVVEEPSWEAIHVGRAALDRSWERYLALPVYPDERKVQPQITEQLAQVQSDVNRVLDLVLHGRVIDALRLENTALKPSIDALDNLLLSLIDINARVGTELATHIHELHRRGRFWALTLNIIAVLLAIAWGAWSLRIVRQNALLLAEQVHELEQFAGRIAHDIRSPLASLGLVLSAARRATADPMLARLGERGARSLERVDQLVAGLLDFARAGAQPVEGAVAEVREVIAGVVEEATPLAEEHAAHLHVEPLPALWVACSSGALHSLVANLVNNALRHMGSAPTREVAVRVLPPERRGRRAWLRRERGALSTVRFEVLDTGPGLAPELQEQVFQPYVRGTAATAGGLGLGLATVRRLAEAHGGAVGVHSKLGYGALFWFELPEAPAPTAAGPDAPGSPTSSGAPSETPAGP